MPTKAGNEKHAWTYLGELLVFDGLAVEALVACYHLLFEEFPRDIRLLEKHTQCLIPLNNKSRKYTF